MMHSIPFIFLTLVAVISLTLALVLDNPLQLLSASAAGNSNATIPNANTNTNTYALPSLPPTVPGFISYACSGTAFGHDLDLNACGDAIRHVGVSTAKITFAVRGTSPSSLPAGPDIPLPRRFISSDGKCVIEPILAPDVDHAEASPEDIAVAGFVVVRNCVGIRGGMGGLARNIGASASLTGTPLTPILSGPKDLMEKNPNR